MGVSQTRFSSLKKEFAFCIYTLILFFFALLPASAKWLTDIYAEAAFTQDKDFIRNRGFPALIMGLTGDLGVQILETEDKFNDLDFDTAPSFGGHTSC